MAWTTPKTHVAGEMATAAIFNVHVRDNLNALRPGGLSLSGQTANDFFYASSATQLARVAAQTNKIPRWNAEIGAYEMVLPLELAWPVGSIYRAAVSTNPATLIGIGTWVAFGTGRCTVSFDASQTDFDTVRKLSGAQTHVLSGAEMPVHTHTQNAHNHTQDAHNHTQDPHDHSLSSMGTLTDVNGSPDDVSVLDNSGTLTTTAVTATNNAATATNQSTVATNQNAGSGTAHSNLMPYIVAYVWERVS